MKKQTIKFSGVITADTGITVIRPNDNFMGGGYSDKTSRLPRAGRKHQDTDVYIPGSTLRGKLRRCAQERIEKLINGIDASEPMFGLDAQYMLRQGVDVTGKVVGEKSAGTIDKESNLRLANPMLSLFGRWKLPGHSCVGGLFPANNDCLMVDGKGARTNDFIREPERIKFLDSDSQAQLMKLVEQDAQASIDMKPIEEKITLLKASRKETSDKDAKNSINEDIKELESQIKDIKANKKTEAIQRPLDGYEAIRPGTELDNQIVLEGVNEFELGLFLQTLAEFARNPRIGGHKNHNYGWVSCEYEITTWPELEDKPITIGQVKISQEGFELTDLTEDKMLENAVTNFIVAARSKKFDFERFLLNNK